MRSSVLASASIAAAAVLLAFGSSAFAQAPMGSAGAASAGRVGVAVQVSTLGLGGDVAVRLSDKANLRAGLSHFSLTHDFTQDDGTIFTARIKVHSIHAFLDWFPMGGGFHLSPGIVFGNDTQASFTTLIASGKTIDIGDATYASSAANPLRGSGSVSVKSTGFAVTMGWGNLVPRTRRFSVPFEIGVVFQGTPTGVLAYTGSACNVNGTNCRDISTDPTIQAEVNKQNITLNDDLNKPYTKYMPVISLGFGIRF
jgi:hypothetical protein